MACALLAGLSWAAAAPPRGWWLMVPIGAAALTLAVAGRGVRARTALAGLCGLGYYVPTLLWLADFAVPAYVAVVLLETAMLAGAVALAPIGVRRVPGGRWWGVPAALVVLEAAQSRFPFGGFPLPALSLSQLDGPFALAAPLGGSLLVTALAASTGCALAAATLTRGRRRMCRASGITLGVAVAITGTLATGGLAPVLSTWPAGAIDAALVQGGGPRGVPAVRTDPRAVTERHLTLARQIPGKPDLVVFPETIAVVPGSIAGAPADIRISELARTLGASVVAGVAEVDGRVFRNAAVLWGPDGRRAGRYEKQHRVPFGEYLPARALLERLSGLTSLVPRDALIGVGEAALGPPPRRMGVVISYEVLFADRVRDAVASGGELVLVPTNAASYVTDEVPAIEVAAARLRAREFARSVLQAAPTGYSVVIDPSGTVVARGPLGTPALLREQVALRTGLTPYARLGDLPTVLAASFLLVGGRVGRRYVLRSAATRARRSWPGSRTSSPSTGR